MTSIRAQNIMNQMMRDAPQLYLVCVGYLDGTTRFYAFSTEEAQESFVRFLVESGPKQEISVIEYGECLLDHTDADDWMLTVH